MSSIKDYLFHLKKFGKESLVLCSNKVKSNETLTIKIKGVQYPFYLRGNTSDIPAFYQIFSFKQYKIVYDFTPAYIFDLGANIGLASLYFANTYPAATIIAVEPEPSNCEMLLKNTGSYKNIHCWQGGVWGSKANLDVVDIHKGKWAFVTREVESIDHSVNAITIDDLMLMFNIPHIDILKLDVESAEKEIFEGAHHLWLPKVKAMIVELHDRYKAGCSVAFFNALINYNFSTRFRGENIICDMKQR